MIDTTKIRVGDFAKQNCTDPKEINNFRKMLYYFIGQGKLDVVTEYGLKLIVMNKRATNFIRQYKK